jgi:hypothetical protein
VDRVLGESSGCPVRHRRREHYGPDGGARRTAFVSAVPGVTIPLLEIAGML